MSRLIDFSTLNELLFGESKYIKEFAEAAVESFTEFADQYATYLPQRDETSLRKAGHKIKPVAQMLGLGQILDEYEKAKTLLAEQASDDELAKSVDIVNEITGKVLLDLKDIIEEQ